jgi:Uma2 family endonuclease
VAKANVDPVELRRFAQDLNRFNNELQTLLAGLNSVAQSRAKLDDLYRVDGKAELLGGRIVRFKPSGRLPSRIALRIAMSLDAHARKSGVGEAFGGGVGYAVPELPSGRESFSPDASFHVGLANSDPMRFIEGAPVFAAEVRSENDYGTATEEQMAAKRADYFLAGTQVVWDVDPIAREIHIYRASDPTHPGTFRSGDAADAEPAVPGWRVGVDELFA